MVVLVRCWDTLRCSVGLPVVLWSRHEQLAPVPTKLAPARNACSVQDKMLCSNLTNADTSTLKLIRHSSSSSASSAPLFGTPSSATPSSPLWTALIISCSFQAKWTAIASTPHSISQHHSTLLECKCKKCKKKTQRESCLESQIDNLVDPLVIALHNKNIQKSTRKVLQQRSGSLLNSSRIEALGISTTRMGVTSVKSEKTPKNSDQMGITWHLIVDWSWIDHGLLYVIIIYYDSNLICWA